MKSKFESAISSSMHHPSMAWSTATTATIATDPIIVQALDQIVADPMYQRLFRLFLLFSNDKMMYNSSMSANTNEVNGGSSNTSCTTNGGRLLRYINRSQADFLLDQITQQMAQMRIRPEQPTDCCPTVCSTLPGNNANGTKLMDTLLMLEHNNQPSQNNNNGNCCAATNQNLFHSVASATAVAEEEVEEDDRVTFRQLLAHLLSICPCQAQLHPLVDRLFSRYVHQIVRKGFLLCRRVRPLPRLFTPFRCCLLPADASPAARLSSHRRHCRSRSSWCRPTASRWRLFWCVLMPGQLLLWPLEAKSGNCDRKLLRQWQQRQSLSGTATLRQTKRKSKGSRNRNNSIGRQNECKWTLKLQRDTQIELNNTDNRNADANANNGRDEQKQQLHAWLLATQTALVEFAHFDPLQRQFWIADMEMVRCKRSPSLLLQFDRQMSCQSGVGTTKSAAAVGNQPLEKQQQQQQTVNTIMPPSLLQREQALERENRELIELLKAERQALEDEETVRELATRMLDEEVQRGDSLKETVQFLVIELEAERQHRMQLEQSLYAQQQITMSNPNSPISQWSDDNNKQSGQEGDQQQLGEAAAEVPMEQNHIPLLISPERLHTPMPKAKKGRRLRDSLKHKKKGTGGEVGGGQQQQQQGKAANGNRNDYWEEHEAKKKNDDGNHMEHNAEGWKPETEEKSTKMEKGHQAQEVPIVILNGNGEGGVVVAADDDGQEQKQHHQECNAHNQHHQQHSNNKQINSIVLSPFTENDKHELTGQQKQ